MDLSMVGNDVSEAGGHTGTGNLTSQYLTN